MGSASRWSTRRRSALLAATTTVGSLFVSAPGLPSATAQAAAGCSLGNGISHVVQLTFDNVHFFRDNPGVLSDLEQMPHLLNFIEGNGTMLSNNHTPLIAHTADDILTNLTGLYGDRQGVGIANGYDYFTPSGTATAASAFSYWTDPVTDSSNLPSTTDHNPNMVYSASAPAVATTSTATGVDTGTPAPWVPFTRAGCNVGNVSTANTVLENNGDITQVFGAGSPEDQQLQADTDRFKDQETADYIGLSVHCAQGAAVCADATAVKYGQTTPTLTARPDLLPDEPGGYAGFDALQGHRYIAPVLGAGTPNLTRNGFPVTNASGNLIDLSGKQINGGFLSTPGFPGFGPITAAQTLAYMADMQESGVPVTYGYIADLHANNSGCSAPGEPASGFAAGPGDPCYEDNARAYDQAFATFFSRLAADNITPANTLFVFTADEGDHFAGANTGRAITPTCTGTPGTTTYACTYGPGKIGELNTNITGLLATEANVTTSFKVEQDSAPEFYVTGNPDPTSDTTRNLERAVGGLTANNPFAGVTNTTGTAQPVANWLADPQEEAILHYVDADPNRTPTFSLFAKPDYFLSTGSTSCPVTPTAGSFATGNNCVTVSPKFAWNHGDYAPEINSTWLGLVGPGVAHNGVDGSGPAQGPNSAGPNSGQGTIPAVQNPGTWADHTDIRPTMLALVGLKDDYPTDGRVLVEDMTARVVPNGLNTPGVTQLMACYKQLNSSVGVFGTDTLKADTAAIESGSAGNDGTYTDFLGRLAPLAAHRDALAGQIKSALAGATDGTSKLTKAQAAGLTSDCAQTLLAASQL